MDGVGNYKIRPGHTLPDIAKLKNTTVPELAKNKGIKNPDKIVAGQPLKVLDHFESGGGSYTVRPGDTLSAIAKKLGTTVSALVTANHIQNPNKIFPGQTLTLPGGSGSTGGTAAPAGKPSKPSTPAANEELGSLSRKYEARGPGTVSTGKGDHGGVSYGSYQFASKNGSAKAFVASLRTSHPDYHAALSGHAPGTKEFSAAWKQLAAKDPKGFDKAQHDYIKATHYDVGAAEIKKATGLDVNQRSQALRDVAWSTSVQHGPKAADDIFKRALAGRDPAKVSDEQLIKDIYTERGRKNANGELAYFPSSSKAVQDGVAARYKSESKDAMLRLALESERGAAPGPAEAAPVKPTGDSKAVKPTGDSKASKVKVPFFSQFEGGHGYTPSDTACFKAASAMAKAAGGTVTGPDRRIQLGIGENSKGQLTVNPKKAAEGRKYIDQQLNANKPVVVGVSHKDASYNADGLTDHFVTITGRGTDEKGRTYYTFHDPGTRYASKGQDTNPNNRFYVDERTGGLYRPGSAARGDITARRYDVAMVRPNA